MTNRYIISIFLSSFLFLRCEETEVIDINATDENLLVVEALITNENKRHEITLSRTFTEFGNSAPMVSDAFVVLNDGNTNMILEQDVDRPGVYLTDSLRALIGRLYTLYIAHEGKEYFAITAAAFGTPLEPLIVSENADGTFEYIYQESNQPSMLEIQVTWDELNDSGSTISKEIQAFYYTLNVIDVNQIFAPDKQKVIFPAGARVFRRKYSLTADHQEFLRSFLSEVDWRGGPFDVAPGNVGTNLSAGAIGYFAVSMVQSDVIIVN